MDWKQEALKRLDALAEKLGTTAQYLWTVLVKQAYIEGIVGTVLFVLCAIYLGIGIRLLFKWGRQFPDASYNEETILATKMTVVGVTGAIALITCLVCLTAFMQLLNPEYYALQQLLGAVKQ
jgi:hypothetical protein